MVRILRTKLPTKYKRFLFYLWVGKNKFEKFKNMSNNIELDKFYTPKMVVDKCIELTFKTIKEVTETIEPSAGNGAFSLKIPNCIAYDLEPEHESIIKQDFLKLELPYKKGRLFIGNPPFGRTNNLARSFFKKCVKLGDYIAFILPIGLLGNNDSLYEFDLIKSIDLGDIIYSGYNVRCCFNIYTRPNNGVLNTKPNYKSELINIYREDQKDYENLEYDFAICRRGNIGAIRTDKLDTQTYKIYVNDRSKVEYVKSVILDFDWANYRPHQSTPYITKNDVHFLFNGLKSQRGKEK